MKLKASGLVFNQDKCLLNENLFTGIGFHITEDREVRAVEYANGSEIGEYQSPWVCVSEKEVALDKDALESNEGVEPFLFEGRRFTGVAYDFDEELCVGEILFENGLIKEEVSFFDGDLPAFYEGVNQGVEQYISWYSDGSLKQFEIAYPDTFRVNFNFDEQGRLKSAMIQGEVVDGMDKVKDRLKYSQISSFTYFENISAAPYLSLSGPGINDEFISYIKMENGFYDMQKVALGNTSLASDGLASLVKNKNVKEMLIDDTRDIIPGILKKLKGERPGCIMELNQENVLI